MLLAINMQSRRITLLSDKNKYSYKIESNILEQPRVSRLISHIGMLYGQDFLKSLFATPNFQGGILVPPNPSENLPGYLITNLYNIIGVAPDVDLFSGGSVFHRYVDLTEHPNEYDAIFGDSNTNGEVVQGFVARPTQYVFYIDTNNSADLLKTSLSSEFPTITGEYSYYASGENYRYPATNLADSAVYLQLLPILHELEGYENGWCD